MVDILSVIQMVVGIALFFAAGYFLSFIFFRKGEADVIERAVYGVTFSLTVPALVVFFLTFLFRVPINALTVYAVFLLIAAGSYAYSQKYGGIKHGHKS